MPDYSAGTASVSIRPDATGFLVDLRRKLSSMRDPGFEIPVDADTSKAREKVRRTKQEASKPVQTQLDIDVQEAENRLRQLRIRERAKKLNIDVDIEADPARAEMQLRLLRARQQARNIELGVDVDTDDANRKLAEFNRNLESLRRSDLLRVNIGAGILAGISPALTGLTQVAAGLQQVAQAGLALPGIFAGAGASLGTLVLGLSGIKDAYDAVSAAAEDSGKDQAAQARASAQASNQLRNAVVDEAQARRDVARATRDAKQELRDLRIEQQGGMLDESRAILEAQKAREDLANGNFTDIRDQILRVAEADQRVIESRNRNLQTTERLNDANSKGIASADGVVAANERLTRQQQQLAEAQAQVAETASAVSSSQEKAAQELAKHGPNAQKFVQTLHDMKPAFLDLRSAAAEPLLAGKAEEFRNFFNLVGPNLKEGIGGIAKGWNENITALFNVAGSEEGRGLIDRILGNTGDAQAKLSAAMDPLVKGVGALVGAGTDALPRLAEGLTGALDRFRDFIVAADEDGRLEKWINDGIDGARMLGESVLNIGKAFTGITKAVGGGRGFLEWLQQATGRLQTFLNSAEGQNKLKEYFEQGRDVMREVMPLLQELPGAFRAVSEGATLYVGGLLPILKEVAGFLGDHPGLVKAAVAAYLAWNTVKPIMGTVMNGISALNTGVIGIGTNFAGTRQKVNDEMGRVNKAFDDAGKPNSKLGTFSSRIAGLGAVGGPIGVLAASSIPLLIGALQELDSQNQLSAEKTDYLNSRQLALEETLDRVTGKLTGQTLDSQINAAQNYDPGGNGGNIANISKGDALAAATSLGIAPDLYGKGLINDQDAQKQIRDVLIKNNLLPEFQANQDLAKTATEIGNLTGGKINQQDLINALINAPGAVDKFTAALTEGANASSGGDPQTAQATINRFNLSGIAQRLSPTGQASVLAGGALTTLSSTLPSGDPTRQANQAAQGQFRVSAAGAGAVGVPAGTPAYSQGPGQGFQVVSPTQPPPNTQGIIGKQNLDGSWTITVPQGAMIEEYEQGSRGRTPGGRNQGFLAELHGQEWVHDAGTVDHYGNDIMNALWRKQIDPKALRQLLPGFQDGGPTDPNDPNYVGLATGQAHSGSGALPGPIIAPNPTSGTGGISNIVNQVVSGAQTPIDTFSQAFMSQITGTSGDASKQKEDPTHGWGPGGPPVGLGGGNWTVGSDGTLVAPLDIRKFGIGPGPAGSGPADWMGFVGKTAGNFLSGIATTLAGGLLDFVGLGSVLSSPYVTGATGIASHFLNPDPNGQQQSGVAANIPFNGLAPAGTALDPATLQALFGPAGAPAGLTSLLTGAPAGPVEPYGLPAGTAINYGGEGFPDWVYQVANQFGVEPSTYSGHQEGSGSNRGIDWRPKGVAWDSPEGAAVMERFANYLKSAPGVEQVIFENAATGSRIGRDPGDRGKDQSIEDYYRDDWAGHRNHVHTRFATSLPLGGQTPAGQTPTSKFEGFLKQLYGTGAGETPGVAPKLGAATPGMSGLKNQAYRMYLAAGLPPDQWAQFDELIQRESSWNPTADNPSSTAFGLGQFLDTTWDDVGGSFTKDPAQQLDYVFKYLKQRYHGSPAEAIAFHDANNWYYNGGSVPGSPMSAVPAVLHGDEFVQRSAAVQKYGKPFMQAVNDGRVDLQAAKKVVPQPTPQPVPDARTKQPQPIPIKQLPAPIADPRVPPPSPPPVATQPPPQAPQAGPSVGPQTAGGAPPMGIVAPPSGIDHTLPWINQAIMSTASTLGNIASTAISAAAAAGSMGASAAGGGAGAGAAGSMVAGLFQQGGKVATKVANVVSSALVGSVPGSFTDKPSGQVVRAEQNRPSLAEYRGGGGNTYNVTGYDPHVISREIQGHEALDRQARLATVRG